MGAGGAECPVQHQHIHTAARSLCCGLTESIPSCAPLCSTGGLPFPFPGMGVFPRNLPAPLEVWEAAGILLVVLRNGENGVIKVVVTELLERHSGRDGGEHWDV